MQPYWAVCCHVPLVDCLSALQLALDPPLLPRQLHVHGPEPDTVVEDPLEHKPLVGFDVLVVPSALPQEPLTATALFAVHGTSS